MKSEKHLAEIILFNDSGEVLLQHRTDDAPTYPGQYCIFGGKIEPDEDSKEAVKRECLEELEYELVSPELVFEITCESKYGKRVKYIYAEKYDIEKKLNLHEGQGMVWVSKDNFEQFDLIDHDLITLQKYFKVDKA